MQLNQLSKPSTDVGPTGSSWQPSGLPAVEVLGLYVHIPFCFHKCHYCDFYSITQQTAHRMEKFVDLLLVEAGGWAGGARGPIVRPKTVFFGGGTPSLLPMDAMRRLIRGLRAWFDFSQTDEWTVECNPATVSIEYAAMLRQENVTRLSFGAQSFDRNELKTLERHHDPADVSRSVAIAREAGFKRINVDLIYAIPGQDVFSWCDSLESAIALGTEHISCYGLTYEPNTPMGVKKRLGEIVAVDEEVELEMLHRTRRRLAEAGYHPYEISNYARPEEECRHNLLYWNGGSYVGLGPSAASHVQGWRWKNRAHLGEWETAVESGGMPTADVEQLSPRQRAGELIMLQLRLARGVRFDEVLELSGIDPHRQYLETLDRLEKLGLLWVDESGFGLSESGLNVADAVAAEFL